MKKSFIYLSIILSIVFTQISSAIAFENYNFNKAEDYSYTGDMYEPQAESFDWLYLNNDERRNRVVEIFKIMFPKGYVTNFPKSYLKDKLKNYLKDKNHKIHYKAVCEGYTHYKDVDLQPFVVQKTNFVYMYALQYTQTPQRTYYYDAAGRLKFVDFRYGDFPHYPFYTKKYDIKGKLIRAMYLKSPEIMYIFGEKGTFIGVKCGNEIYGFKYDPTSY